MISDERFRLVLKSSKTMNEARRKLKMPGGKFYHKAKTFKEYSPNRGGKGIKKPHKIKITLAQIFAGRVYDRNRLRKRLIREGLKKQQCELKEKRGYVNQ